MKVFYILSIENIFESTYSKLKEITDGFEEIIDNTTGIINSIKTISINIINILPNDIKTVVLIFLPIFASLIFFKLYGKVKGN